MNISEVWEILEKFKNLCRNHGWRVSDDEDWVAVDGCYHSFLMTRWIHPSSFKKIASNRKCIVREGLSYCVFEATYVAWLFSEPPQEDVVKLVLGSTDLCRNIALYDLGLTLEKGKACGRLNKTSSLIFRKFENFLQDELEVKFKPLLTLPRRAEINGENVTIPEII
jgi:hypothetical protein